MGKVVGYCLSFLALCMPLPAFAATLYQAPYVTAYDYAVSPINVTLTTVLYPSWPNAGFGPQTYAAFALATVLLLGAGIALYQHVRKDFIVVTR